VCVGDMERDPVCPPPSALLDRRPKFRSNGKEAEMYNTMLISLRVKSHNGT
jgi:hypothetical protein